MLVLSNAARQNPATSRAGQSMPTAFVSHYRCPSSLATFGLTGELSESSGFFTLGEAMCYGRTASEQRGNRKRVVDVSGEVRCGGGRVDLPCDLSEIVANFQMERYKRERGRLGERISGAAEIRSLYYLVRPLLTLSVRKQLQKLTFNGWDRIAFPRWPVDFTVETVLEYAMKQVLTASGPGRVPFIWFWPEGAPSCAIMTHDVEDKEGRDFCDTLMDVDESHGIKAAFQIVPERRYQVTHEFLERLRCRGFEVNVHDLNHDGLLFRDEARFRARAARINDYGHKFQSRGFRAGIMYRRQDWFDALNFSYDMSVPNVAHLEPQRGGCCTVTPYFIGNVVELPLTTIQDYSLFHILGDYSIALWQTQIEQIVARHGLVSFITHPDYLIDQRARSVYEQLLAHLRALREEGTLWMALPGEVDRWWRDRSQMTLVRAGDSWRIEGPGADRARLAWATLDGDRVTYELDGRVANP